MPRKPPTLMQLGDLLVHMMIELELNPEDIEHIWPDAFQE